MVVSKEQYRHGNTLILIRGTPPNGPPNFGNVQKRVESLDFTSLDFEL